MTNAFMWTVTLFAGGTPGKPVSVGGKLIRAIGLASQRFVMIAAISGVTAVLTLGMKTTNIERWSDLEGHRVCVSAPSTASAYLDAHNVGFTTKRTNSVDQMFAEFWKDDEDACDAVVYDGPMLEYNLAQRSVRQVVTDCHVLSAASSWNSYTCVCRAPAANAAAAAASAVMATTVSQTH